MNNKSIKNKLLFIIFLGFIICIKANYKVNAKTAVPNNYECTYNEDVNTAKSIKQILQDIQLTAEDEYDGDLTDAISIEDLDDYENRVSLPDDIAKRKLGTYRVVCTVKDSSNNIAKITIRIIVEDKMPPTFSSMGTYEYTIDIDNISLTDEQILANIKAVDDHDETDLTKEIVSGSIGSLAKTINIEQKIKVRVTDKSGNYAEKDIIIILKDNAIPVISADESTVRISYSANSSIETILANLNIKVSDNYDKNLTYEVSSDSYSQNKNKIGTYQVYLTATDSSGNVGSLAINIIVEDTIPPVFYLDTDKITVYVETSTILTRNDFIALLKKTNRIKEDNFEIFDLKNEYINNETKTGTYKYNIRLAYGEDDVDDYQFIVNVINKIVEKNPSFFKSFFNAIKKIGLLILNILRWPIDKIRKLF